MGCWHIEAEIRWLPFAHNIFEYIFLMQKFIDLIEILLKFISEGPIDNRSALVQAMTWQQAFSWTSDNPIPWCIYPYGSLSLRE